jgi:hypothetical protein
MGSKPSSQAVCLPEADASVAGKSLEDLPDELLEVILREACTDGGRAGCAISLISRRIHKVGVRFRYRSIALSGDARICAFRELVDARQSRGQPVPAVEALFLQHVHRISSPLWQGPANTTFDSTGLVPKRRPKSLGACSRLQGRAGARRIVEPQEDEPFETYAPSSSISSLLSVLSPTLQCLALVIDCPRVATLVPVALPSLTELTCLFVSHPILNAPYRPLDGPNMSQTLPALRYLHLAAPMFSSRFFALRELPPALTHLRLTNETHLEENLKRLSTPDPGHLMPELWPPRTLRRILLSPDEWLIVPLFEETSPVRWWRAAQSGVDISKHVAIVRNPAPYDA